MNFKIKKDKLENILQVASKAISQNIAYPFLKNILIEVFIDKIIFITSDSHISIKTELNNKDYFAVEEEGKILLDEKIISEITKKIESDYINIETMDGDLITIYGGKSKYKINTVDVNNYSEIDFSYSSNRFKVKTSLLKSIIDKTAYACSEKEIHPNLTGINLFSKNGELHASATDQFRFSQKTFKIEGIDEFNIIVPKKYFSSIIQCFNEEDEVELAIQSNKILFFINESTIQIDLVEDLFPDISNLFNQKIEGTLVINKQKILKMIDRCSLIKDEKNNTVVKIEIKDNKIHLSSHFGSTSSNEEEEIKSYEGNDVDILFSSRFLLEAIKVIESEDVIIQFTGPIRPIIIKDTDDTSLTMLVSPQRP